MSHIACSASLCWLQLAVAVAATAAERGEEDRGQRKLHEEMPTLARTGCAVCQGGCEL